MVAGTLTQYVKAATYVAAVTSVNQVLSSVTGTSKSHNVVEVAKDGLQYIVSIMWD